LHICNPANSSCCIWLSITRPTDLSTVYTGHLECSIRMIRPGLVARFQVLPIALFQQTAVEVLTLVQDASSVTSLSLACWLIQSMLLIIPKTCQTTCCLHSRTLPLFARSIESHLDSRKTECNTYPAASTLTYQDLHLTGSTFVVCMFSCWHKQWHPSTHYSMLASNKPGRDVYSCAVLTTLVMMHQA